MSTICFETVLLKIGDWTIIRLPESASAMLPSPGMALVEGTINGFHSKIVLEPDGKGSHWFRVDAGLREAAGIDVNDPITVAGEPSKDWPEPEVPADLNRALASDPQANADHAASIGTYAPNPRSRKMARSSIQYTQRSKDVWQILKVR